MVSPSSPAFLRSQFQVSKLLFNINKPLLLGTPQIDKWQRLYIVYRAVWAVWWTSFLLCDMTTYFNQPDSFYEYMSNWSVVLLAASSTCQLASAIYCHLYRTYLLQGQRNGLFTGYRGTPLILKINWLIYDMSSPVAIFISIAYFTAIHTIQKEDEPLTVSTFVVHLVNSVYVLLDMALVAVPFRLLHFWLPELFGITYTAFSILHWAGAGAAPVYKVLDYSRDPGLSAAYLLGVAFIACPLFHLITFGLYWTRLCLYTTLLASPEMGEECVGSGEGHSEQKVKVRFESEPIGTGAVVVMECATEKECCIRKTWVGTEVSTGNTDGKGVSGTSHLTKYSLTYENSTSNAEVQLFGIDSTDGTGDGYCGVDKNLNEQIPISIAKEDNFQLTDEEL